MKTFLIVLAVILLGLFTVKRSHMTWRQSLLKTLYPLIMLKGKWFPNQKQVQINLDYSKPNTSFYDLQANSNDGTEIAFSKFRGKKILIVNTASNCGYTAQYDELEKLHRLYNDKLVVLGFPANDFKDQEQSGDTVIAQFCKVNFGITFPLMQKVQVIKSPAQHPVFRWLTESEKNGWCKQPPTWNFNKYLVDEDGVLIGYFAHTVSPLDRRLIAALN